MSEIRTEHRVTTDRVVDDPVAVDRGYDREYSVRHTNPVPVIAAICIALLVVFLIVFGMSRGGNGTSDHGSNDGSRVTITVPKANDDGAGGANSSSGSSTGTNTNTDTKTSTSSGSSNP